MLGFCIFICVERERIRARAGICNPCKNVNVSRTDYKSALTQTLP